MKLSIIVVSYNEAEYLKDCFNSIINQNLNFEYEIIVGDDCSSDNSIEIIKEYQKKIKNLTYFIQDRDPKLTLNEIIPSLRASNIVFKAMNLAKGKYIHLISGDDYLIDMNLYQRAILFLDNQKKYAAYLTNFCYVYPDGEIENNKILSKDHFSFWYSQYIHISCFIFRKLEKKYLLNRFSDDIGLQYSISLKGNLKYTEEISFAYRQREKSIMHTNKQMELFILELMIFQDTLNLKLPCLSKIKNYMQMQKFNFQHFKGVFYELYYNHKQLDEDKYKKYLDSSKNYKNNILGCLFNPDKPKNKVYLNNLIKKINSSDKIISLKKILKVRYSENVKLPDYPVINNNIKYNIEESFRIGKSTYIKGWAFVPYKNAEVYIKVDNNVYYTFMINRPDVKKILTESIFREGFQLSIPSLFDVYDIILVNNSDKEIYITSEVKFLNQNRMAISVPLPKYSKGEDKYVKSIAKKYKVNETELKYSIDGIKKEAGKTYLFGWAFVKDLDSVVYVKVGNKYYQTKMNYRTDVKNAFTLNTDTVGFDCEIKKNVKRFQLAIFDKKNKILYLSPSVNN